MKNLSRITPYYALAAEGYRIGIASCLECGVAILIDKDDAGHRHGVWHRRNSRKKKARKP